MLRPFYSPFRISLEQLFDHGGYDVPWRDGVDADVVLAPLSGQIPAELDDGRLAGVVGTSGSLAVRIEFTFL